jgi:hypothetical protein
MNFSHLERGGAISATSRQSPSRPRSAILPAATGRLPLSQFRDGGCGDVCVNVGKVYVRPLSVKSNSPEGPLRRVPDRHTVYFPYRDPYYAVAERRRGADFVTMIVPAPHRPVCRATERHWRHVSGHGTDCPRAWAVASPTNAGKLAHGAALHDRRSARADRTAAHSHGFLSARGDHPADDTDGERLPALRSRRAGDPACDLALARRGGRDPRDPRPPGPASESLRGTPASAQRDDPAASEERDYRPTNQWAEAGIGNSVRSGVGDQFSCDSRLPTYDSRGMTKAGAPTPAFLPTHRL